MRWNIETHTERIQRLSGWHLWFAWFPVYAYNNTTRYTQMVWLEYVRRRGEYSDGMKYSGWIWSFEVHENKLKRND